MKLHLSRRPAALGLIVCVLVTPLVAQDGDGSPTPDAATSAKSEVPANVEADLRFNFSGTNWLAVLEWFADEADLALQVHEPPIGSFSFADPSRSYSISEALDVINLALMKRGYSLVRRGRML